MMIDLLNDIRNCKALKVICTITLCLFLAYPDKASAQLRKPDTIPLFNFFQKNFDSTVVWFPYSALNSEPNYKIVMRAENRSFCFTYQEPYSKFRGRSLPKVLYDRFENLLQLYRSTLPDTNQFFLPLAIHNNADIVWNTIKEQNIWALKDDITDSLKCRASALVMNSHEHDFILITKSSIRLLHYYDMESCRENGNRQKISKIMNAFTTVFGKWY